MTKLARMFKKAATT